MSVFGSVSAVLQPHEILHLLQDVQFYCEIELLLYLVVIADVYM